MRELLNRFPVSLVSRFFQGMAVHASCSVNIVDPPPLSLKTHKCDPDMSTVTCLAILSSSKKQMVASNNAIYNPQMSHFRMLVRIFQMMAVITCELCKIFIENKIQKCCKTRTQSVLQMLIAIAIAEKILEFPRILVLIGLRFDSFYSDFTQISEPKNDG